MDWAQWVQALLASVVAAPEAPVSALGILTTAERELVLHKFQTVEAAPSRLLHPEQTVHGLLEHWAQATPSAVSAIYEARNPGVMRMLWHLILSSIMHGVFRQRMTHRLCCRASI